MKQLLLLITICSSSVSFGQTNNYSLEFDGVNGFVEIQDNQNLDLDQSDFTIFSWVKLREFSEEGIFDHLDNGGCGRLNFRINFDGTLRLSVKDDNCNNFYASTNYIFSDTNWHHVAVTFDYSSENVVFMIDGSIESHIVGANGLVSGINPVNNLILGAYGSAYYSNSIISGVAFWNTILTEQEIQQYMDCPPTGNESGLVGYWNFEEGSGTTTIDQTSNGNNGALIGGVTWSPDVPPYNCCTPDPITTQPTDVTVPINGTGIFSTTTSVTSPTYQWQMDTGTGYMNLTNAGQFSGVDTDMFTVSNVTLGQNNTLFRCIVSENSNCSDTTDVAVLLVENNTSLEELNQQINIYPNPTTSFLTIEGEGIENKEYALVDIQGRIVLNGTFKTNKETIDLKNLATGQYMLRVEGKEMKVVKE